MVNVNNDRSWIECYSHLLNVNAVIFALKWLLWFALYSGDLNIELVWYSNDWKQLSCQMLAIKLNGLWISRKYLIKIWWKNKINFIWCLIRSEFFYKKFIIKFIYWKNKNKIWIRLSIKIEKIIIWKRRDK